MHLSIIVHVHLKLYISPSSAEVHTVFYPPAGGTLACSILCHVHSGGIHTNYTD